MLFSPPTASLCFMYRTKSWFSEEWMRFAQHSKIVSFSLELPISFAPNQLKLLFVKVTSNILFAKSDANSQSSSYLAVLPQSITLILETLCSLGFWDTTHSFFFFFNLLGTHFIFMISENLEYPQAQSSVFSSRHALTI